MIRRSQVALIAAALLLLPGSLRAGDGNYQDFLIGERASGMGGAVTASAVSVDACFYNPAGLSQTPSDTISLSASLYGFYRFQADDGWYPGENIDVDSFITIPSTVGSILKLDDDTSVALSAFIPDRGSSNDLDAFVANGHYFKYNKDDQTLWIGPSIGHRFSPEFSAGISVFAVYRTFSWFRDWLWGLGGSLSEDIKYNDLGLLAVLGAKYALGENWAVGLTLQTPSLHLSGSGRYLLKQVTGSGTVYASYVDDADTENKIPTKLAAGVAYGEAAKYTLGLDVSYHLPVSFNRFEGYDQFGTFWFYPLRREGTVDVNLGGEYYLGQGYPLRLGFFTSNSSAPKTDTATSWYPAHINKYGITASIGSESEHTTLNLGVNYVWGSGDFVGWSTPSELDIVGARESYLYIFLGSSYIF